MWLLGRLYPDHKSIAEFRRVHRDAISAAGGELIRFARGCGLIRGEWIAIDGSKFRAVASVDSTRERLALQRYLDEDALNRMQDRVTPEAMKLRRSTVEHPFETIKYRIFGHPRFLMRGLSGARIEIGIATMAYNLKRIAKILGAAELTKAFRHA
jgi:hypothetical protein